MKKQKNEKKMVFKKNLKGIFFLEKEKIGTWKEEFHVDLLKKLKKFFIKK